LGFPFTRLLTEAVERWKCLSAYQPDSDLVKVAIQYGIHVTLGNRRRPIGNTFGRHPFEHLGEIVSALRDCCR
jgi:hypothetical protein